MTLYGIPNCDITKKTLKWLDEHRIKYSFHDYKTQGISKEKLQQWIKEAGLDKIFNKRSTTWRELDAETQASVKSDEDAIRIMMQHNSIIKRPVIESKKGLIVGFDEKKLEQLL